MQISELRNAWNEGKFVVQLASIVQFPDKGNDLCKLPVQLLDFAYQLGYNFDMFLQLRKFAGCALLLLRTAARDADFFMIVPAVSTKFTFPNKLYQQPVVLKFPRERERKREGEVYEEV